MYKVLRMRFLLIILCFITLNTVLGQNGEDWNVLENSIYSIKFPKDWQLDTSGRNKTEFIILSKREENDPFRENVNLIVQDLSNYIMNLESYVNLSKETIKKTPFSKVISSKEITNNNILYHEIIWKGYVSKKLLKFKQLYFINNNKAYSLTFTTQEKEFENYLPVGNKILNSFTIK